LNEGFAQTGKPQKRSRRFPRVLEVRQNRHGFVKIRGATCSRQAKAERRTLIVEVRVDTVAV
jgi:hypothetical protein